MHDLPPNLLVHEKIAKIGALFHSFHYYEPSLEAMLGWHGFIRARVDTETNMPLILGVICLDTNGKEFWIRFQYERLGEICCRCGRITHPTSRSIKPSRPDEGINKQTNDSYGPWMRAKEILGKHYPARKQVPLEAQEELPKPDIFRDPSESNQRDASPEAGKPLGEANRKKRKAIEEAIISPIHESARRAHTSMMNTVAELATDLHNAVPIHASASRPSWKRLARKAKVTYQPTTVDLIQAFEMVEGDCIQGSGNGSDNGMPGNCQVGFPLGGE
ncbi:hypothetical protein Tsubulata_000679 [Turnera subulata]|uniref:Zinc knuckle CX2CX4HX4C domain-containing protein n=1 Tax=Turnera subulata TaxID=218843 RepID=A0A9Q0FGP4_9ROSI|nr:hypothetical protein Tsubulata_000679 [Turnera subulata]